MKRCLGLVLLTLLLALCRAQAEGLVDEYVRIYGLIQQADRLESVGQSSQALATYTEAQAALQAFQRGNPDWNTKVVSFRLNYLAGQIAALSAKVPPPTAPQTPQPSPAANASPAGGAPQAARPAVPGDSAEQLSGLKSRVGQLQEQVGQLQSDKSLLEAKLKEAFAAQPAPADVQELAKVQEQIKKLQEENDLLKVSLEKEKSKPAASDAKALQQAQQALAETNRKLSAQTDKANALAQEKQFLQNKLSALVPENSNAAAFEASKKALDEANRQLAEQKALSARLALEKDALQAHIKTLAATNNVQPPAAVPQPAEADLAALRAENALLRKQLADTKTVPSTAGKADELAHELTEAKAQLAALQSDKELWRLEKTALESRVRQLQSSPPALAQAPAPAPVPALAPGKSKDAERIQIGRAHV
jgi:hypothetical protein